MLAEPGAAPPVRPDSATRSMESISEIAYVTPQGMAKLEAELDILRNVKLVDISDRLHEAMVGGDSIDNTEYLLVQEELAHVEGRILELEYILRHAELIQPGEMDGTIHLGSTVAIQGEEGELETYTLVGPTEANPSVGLISDRSPLGRALLNHTTGDEVKINTPDGPLTFRIIGVS